MITLSKKPWAKIPCWESGVWLDGRFGWHNAYRVVLKAKEWGFEVPAEDQWVMDEYCQNGDSLLWEETEEMAETVNGQGGLADQATEFLQYHAPDGYQFIWDMGELTLMTDLEASHC
ncbi:hypothetical protein [Streptomyces werraensis]|uniref:hypothetical protein n=1 Tax=Streptomyces werraensis TaxID=68284 RepID=UPI0037015683